MMDRPIRQAVGLALAGGLLMMGICALGTRADRGAARPFRPGSTHPSPG